MVPVPGARSSKSGHIPRFFLLDLARSFAYNKFRLFRPSSRTRGRVEVKKFSFVVAVVIAITGMAGSAFGQGFPLPTQCVANCDSTTPTAGPSVTCPGCPAVRTGFNNTTNQWVLGNPPYPYSDPIVAFTGRYVDSVFTRDWQQTFRTARSYGFKVNPERNRIYFTLGSAVATALGFHEVFR